MTDFSFSSVADNFDEHIRKSIHGYDTLFEATVGMSKTYIKNDTYVLDIGCSKGTLIQTIHDRCPINKRYEHEDPKFSKPLQKYAQMKMAGETYNPVYIGIDVDESFINSWKPHYTKNEIWNGLVRCPFYALADIKDWKVNETLPEDYKQNILDGIGEEGWREGKPYTVFPMKNHKIEHCSEEVFCNQLTEDERDTSAMIVCDHFKEPKFSYITSLFTFQFLQREVRDQTIEKIKKVLHKEGALVVAEKIYSQDGHIQNMYEFLNIDYKRKSFSEKEILDKEQSLRNMANYFTEEELMSYYSQHFKVSVFWRNLNFIGLLCRL